MKQASGEWILFLDADDFWKNKYVLKTFEKLTETAHEKTSIIRAIDYAKDKNETAPRSEHLIIEYLSGKDLLASEKYDKDFYVIWTSCYRRTYLIETNLFFVENMFFEDSDWSIRTLWKASTVMMINYSFVHHRLTPTSAASIANPINFMDDISAVSLVDNLIEQYKMTGEVLIRCRKRNLRSVLGYAKKTRKFRMYDSIDCLKHLRKDTELLSSSKYNLSTTQHFLFVLMRHFPKTLVFGIKILTLTKRNILKWAGKSK